MTSNVPPVLFKKEEGSLRSPAYPGDAGMDVEVTVDSVCKPHSVTKIPIGVKISPPHGTVYTFITRSSAIATGIFVLPTLIDHGYRGDLFLFAMNFTDNDIMVPSGVRIAQVVLLPNLMEGREVQLVDELPPSVRGEKSFGSSGGQVQ